MVTPPPPLPFCMNLTGCQFLHIAPLSLYMATFIHQLSGKLLDNLLNQFSVTQVSGWNVLFCGNTQPLSQSCSLCLWTCVWMLHENMFVTDTLRLGRRKDSHVAWCEFLLLQDVREDGIGAWTTGTVTAGGSGDIYTSKRQWDAQSVQQGKFNFIRLT